METFAKKPERDALLNPGEMVALARSALLVYPALLTLRAAKRRKGTEFFRVTHKEITAQTDLKNRSSLCRALRALEAGSWIKRRYRYNLVKSMKTLEVAILRD